MAKSANSELWVCPLCTHRIAYGETCPDVMQSIPRDDSLADACTRGVKNIVYHTKRRISDSIGLGISEIANDEM